MNTPMRCRWIFAGFTVWCLLLAHANGLAAPAGRVQFVSGQVVITPRDRAPREARKGDEINIHDLIVTGAAAAAQLLMADGSVIAVRAESRLRIESYHYDSGSTGIARSVLNLLQGGVRAITAAAGRPHSHDYQVYTTTATIGVRGTDHEVFHILAPEPGKNAVGHPGTYDRVYSGGTYMKTSQGTLELGPGQVGYAADANKAPVLLNEAPSFMTRDPANASGSTTATGTILSVPLSSDSLLSDSPLQNVNPSLPPPVLPDPNSIPPLPLPGTTK